MQGGDRALQLSTAPEPVPIPLGVTRTFANQNTTMYFSFLMRVPASGTGSDKIEVKLLSGSSLIRSIRFTPTNPSPPVGNLGIFTETGGVSYPVAGDGSQTHLIVFQFTPSSGGYSYSLWIDPAYSGYSSPKGSGSTSGSVPNSFDGLSLNIASADSAGPTTTVIVDELRLGYTWSSVVLPPPEPSLVPDVALGQAFNLRWQSQSGKTYQVQYTYDLTTWFNFGSPVSGNGQIKEVFDAKNSDAKKFYRIQVQ